ncbi:MAG: HEAT repeat domain-containing protein [Planctomycetota bacterium]|nr:HEAT repeat domain-containing protein [Planctomycetota bacterium]
MNRFTILLFFVDAMIRGARRPSTLDGLLHGLKHDDPFARRRAATALSMLSYDVDVAAPALVQALIDPDPRVRQDVALALKRMGQCAVPYLTAQVQYGPAALRRKVLVLLGLNQPRSVEVQAALMGALGDKDHGVRNAAAWALLRHRTLRKVSQHRRRGLPKTRRKSSKRRMAQPRKARQSFAEPGEPYRLRFADTYARTIRAAASSWKSPIALRVSTMSLAFCPSC